MAVALRTLVSEPLRTERQIAANALYALIARGFLAREHNMRELCACVGISTTDLIQARQRFEGGETVAPRVRREATRGPEIAAPADWQPKTAGPRSSPAKTLSERVKRANPAPGLRRCSGCKKTKPVTEFDFKSPTTNGLRSRCRPCAKQYQRDRYLTVTKATALDRAVAILTVLEGDGCIGLACPKCQKRIKSGDKIALEGKPRHADCHGRR